MWLVALVDQLMLGWCKWEDKKPVDYHVGFVRDRFKPPKRSELRDADPTRRRWRPRHRRARGSAVAQVAIFRDHQNAEPDGIPQDRRCS
jgi:hypothetical protein